jgi:hypothetical protein
VINDEYCKEDNQIGDEPFEENEFVDDSEDIIEGLDSNDAEDFIENETDEFEDDEVEVSGNIEDLDTMDIPYTGFSTEERRVETRQRGQSRSGVIDGVNNDTQLPPSVSYNDCNRDREAGAIWNLCCLNP